MTTVVQFSWSRLEGLGLIAVTLGWGFIAQLPPIFFTLALLHFNLEEYFIALTGTILGTSIILATISCSFAEDWDDSTAPTLKSVTTSSFSLTFIFICGFFLFFLLEPFFPPEFTNLDSAQRYFSAMTLALTLIGIFTFIVYKAKSLFFK
ncbi:MAG: hypothetical protein JSU57_06630 [Candidatus Heimdallarchaeota archaeon]|nr:MAG: hypothetical protein JSU57_06630 [Candidatus Heimdallarchaeota archaeon]